MPYETKSERRARRNRRKQKKREFKIFLNKCSDALNTHLPPSEVWFHRHWKDLGLSNPNEDLNRPWLGCVPDVVNHVERYVIEIDGKSHDTEKQRLIDAKKDCKFKRQGYLVYRVRAYDIKSLLAVADDVRVKRWAREIKTKNKILMREYVSPEFR